MGIKLLKERFNIKHIVQMEGDLILIGSVYVSNIITIRPDHTIFWSSGLGASKNDDLSRYFKEMNEARDSGELTKIINEPDQFENTMPVWTNKDGKIIKKVCEKFGYPNITTDGELMYDNTFFKSRKAALKDCRSSILYMITSRNWIWHELVSQFKCFIKWEYRKYRDFIRAFIMFGY